MSEEGCFPANKTGQDISIPLFPFTWHQARPDVAKVSLGLWIVHWDLSVVATSGSQAHVEGIAGPVRSHDSAS